MLVYFFALMQVFTLRFRQSMKQHIRIIILGIFFFKVAQPCSAQLSRWHIAPGYQVPAFASSFVPLSDVYGDARKIFASYGEGASLQAGLTWDLTPALSLQAEAGYLHGAKQWGIFNTFETFRTLEWDLETYARMVSLAPMLQLHLLNRVYLKAGPLLGLSKTYHKGYFPKSRTIVYTAQTSITPGLGIQGGLGATLIKTKKMRFSAELLLRSLRMKPSRLIVDDSGRASTYEVTFSREGEIIERENSYTNPNQPLKPLPYGSLNLQLGIAFDLSSQATH